MHALLQIAPLRFSILVGDGPACSAAPGTFSTLAPCLCAIVVPDVCIVSVEHHPPLPYQETCLWTRQGSSSLSLGDHPYIAASPYDRCAVVSHNCYKII